MLLTPTSETRGRILDAAEALFVEQGLNATSLRQITAKAAVNLASVNYHFGSREALIGEVFRRRLLALNEARLAALDRLEAEAKGGAVKASKIIEAFFGTALDMAADPQGAKFMRLLGRTYSAPAEFVRSFLAAEYSAAMPRFKAALIKALPHVPREEILWRFHFMIGAMAYALSGADALSIAADLPLGRANGAALKARLLAFLLGGLRAPLADLAKPASGKARASSSKRAGQNRVRSIRKGE